MSDLSGIDSPDIDRLSSFGGHGTKEAWELSRLLEEADVPCCFSGVSALIYYGVVRARNDWELCVPTELLPKVESLLKSDAYASIYRQIPPRSWPQPGSLNHLCPRFKLIGVDFSFIVIPSRHVHFVCESSNIRRSHHGLPYPKLKIFVQSLLEMSDRVSLFDVVDGSDVSEQWGTENLDLDGTNDVEWSVQRNEDILHQPGSVPPVFGYMPTQRVNKRELWQWAVNTKQSRRGSTQPPELFSTRFRLHNSMDPWLEARDCC
ncbi:hypothetical protein B0T10DRAFT_516043 [Thelonectria olida]|uniref:Uncharacterized protein n=1 Tax=Thelonectria olida TaxID=1576542 RepID=A0A9P8W3N7_9HYPO|nr:hypothetical protein B0T10DRAFT_516043 [Thelonectria olida]